MARRSGRLVSTAADMCPASPAGLTSTLQSEYAAVTGSAAEPDADSQLRSPDVSKAAGDSLAEGADAGSTADAQHSHPAPQFLVYLAALLPPLAVASAHPGSFLTLLSVSFRPCICFLRSCYVNIMQFNSSTHF